MVHKQVWRNATGGKSGTLQPYHSTVKVANGQFLTVQGSWSTVMNMDSLNLTLDFVVANESDQCALIGTDFLVKYGAVPDLRNKTCCVLGKQIPLIFRGAPGGRCKVTMMVIQLSGYPVIPSRNEMFITGKVETVNNYKTEGLLEPCVKVTDTSNLLVACSVCSSVKEKLPVRVMNPDSQLLREGTELGRFSIWEKGREDCIVANLQDSNQPTYFPTTTKCDVEQLMQALGIDCSELRCS